jgi:2-polyprenyl-3-methyl-5-hydroxy-6-metoxy-1,4-benzoquinol methylase
MTSVKDVKHFWESNPLFSGESYHEIASKNWFEEHERIYTRDCFAGSLDKRIFANASRDSKVLDLGCGVGMWLSQFAKRGYRNLTGADLTSKALSIAQKRADTYGYEYALHKENAEELSYENCSFDHVNCQGVIHHTPNTENCIKEISRILKPDGTALISVYYKNIILRNWKLLYPLGKILGMMKFGMKGRGREDIFKIKNMNDLTRLYDGADNPIGKVYSKMEFSNLLKSHFKIEEVFFHFFPARSFPFKIPKVLHRFLDQRGCPFMIFASLKKEK